MKYTLFLCMCCVVLMASCRKNNRVIPSTTVFATVTGFSPTAIREGMTVTFTGTNLNTSSTEITVYFSGAKATVLTRSDTEMTVEVPVLPAEFGNVQVISGMFILKTFPYTSAPKIVEPGVNVILANQEQVDAFVQLNKEKTVQIKGNLLIGAYPPATPDVEDISGLSLITSVGGVLSIFNCPKITDLSGLSNVTSVGSVSIVGVGAAALALDKLTSVSSISLGSMFNFTNKALTRISFKALSSVTGTIGISQSPQISTVDFSALTLIGGGLNLNGTMLPDLSGFRNLKTAGSLMFIKNMALNDLTGLESLITLTSPALRSNHSSTDLSAIAGGIYLSGNTKLSSLKGLENLSAATVPFIYIVDNTGLNNFCPFKAPLNSTATLGPYTYTSTKNTSNFPEPVYVTITNTVPALTLKNNGQFATTADALKAVSLCR